MTNSAEKSALLRIKITGQPGSGGSTLATNIENQLGQEHLKRISGGKLRRAEAFLWQLYQQDYGHEAIPITEAEAWARFEKYFSDRYFGLGLAGITEMLERFFDLPSDNGVLNAFNHAQETYSPNAIIWDMVTDSFLLHETEQTNQSYILESKLAVALSSIAELSRYAATNQVWALPSFQIYLTVQPEVARQRINQREKNPVSLDQVIARRTYDWHRYSSFYHDTATNAPLSEGQLQTTSYVIDTSHLDEEEVLTEALLYLLCQLNELTCDQPEMAQVWIAKITQLLQQPNILNATPS